MTGSSVWQRFVAHPAALPALLVLLAILLAALLGNVLSPHSPFAAEGSARLLPPLWREGGVAQHPLGTDDLGRDMLARLLSGARWTMGLATIVVALSMLVGVVLGTLAAMGGRVVDLVIMRITDVLLALPSLLLAVLLASLLGAGLLNTIYAVAASLVPHFVRVTRTALRDELQRDYVAAARLDGIGGVSLFVQTLLPNVGPAIIVQTTLAFSTAVLDIAALGFLGLGAQPPLPEWGALLASAHDYILVAPWTVTLPGMAIFITVLCANLVGDALRDALAPRGAR